MAKRLVSALSYNGAGLTLFVTLLVPFVLMGFFANLVARSGVRVDSVYSGGEVERTVMRPGYQIRIYRPVYPRFLQRTEPYVQLALTPVSALPATVRDEIDIDGDGQPDVRVRFAVPANPRGELKVDVLPLHGRYGALRRVHAESFSRLIVRTGDQILVRIPIPAKP
jgi:hypothetical protein